jgi:hypothetical protein
VSEEDRDDYSETSNANHEYRGRLLDPTGNYAVSFKVSITVLGVKNRFGTGNRGRNRRTRRISIPKNCSCLACSFRPHAILVLGEEEILGSETDEGTDGPEEFDPKYSVCR